MAKSMQVVMKADAAQFVANMNKVDAQINETAKQTQLAAGSLQGLASGFDVLTGKAIPGLSQISQSFGAARQIADSLGKSWEVLKTKDFTTRVIAGMNGYTTSTIAADGATKALTASTMAYQTAATLGIAAVVYGITQVVSATAREREETERLTAEKKQLREEEQRRLTDAREANVINATNAARTYNEGLVKKVESLYPVQLTKEQEINKLIEEREKTVKRLADLERDTKYGFQLGSYSKEEGNAIKELIESYKDTIKQMSGLEDTLKIAEQDRLKVEEENIRKQQEANKKINDDKITNVQKILDLTMTAEERLARDRERQLQELQTAVAEGNATNADVIKFREFMANENVVAPTIAEQATGTPGLSAMSVGSLAAHQTILQTQDPNTKMLEGIIAALEAQTKVNREQVDEQKKTNETLQG